MIQKFIRALQVLGIILVLAILAYPLITILSYHFVYKNKIYPNVSVLENDLSAKTKNQALILLNKQIQSQNFEHIEIKYNQQVWKLNLSDYGFKYLPNQTINKAYDFGRENNLKKDVLNKWKVWKQGIQLDLDFYLNNDLLQTNLATISATIDIPAIPPTIEIVYLPEKIISINPDVPGKTVNKTKLIQTIEAKLAKQNQPIINMPVDTISFITKDEQLEETKKRAENLLGKKIILSFLENEWQIEEEEIINFLNFEGSFDENKIASYSAQLARSIDRPAQNALFNFLANGDQENQGRVTEFKPARDGQHLNQQKTTELLAGALKGLEAENNTSVKVSLPVDLTKPEIDTEHVNDLGIKKLLGKGESWFRGSITSRIHNVSLAAQKMNGLLISPGETFSFNNALGDVSAQTGFKQAYIIKEGRTVLGDGGGVCQVSTTLFRAALKAGLPIESRSPHAYRVSYYEQNSQVGLDATVFEPSPDFKFKNDTNSYILIQSYSDTKNYKLTFELYGSWDGREITISESRIWDQIPPPPDLYQDDPTLPVGVVKQVDWKAWGAKTAFDWKVVRGNEVLQERTFYSNFKPWQAIFLKGTGGQ
ncbi:VanW family protein [Patescibacteria group bacterium]